MKNHIKTVINKISIIFAVVLFPVLGFSQSYVAISVGPSVPLGQYSQSDILDNIFVGPNLAGSANTGFQASIDAAYYFDSHFGISFMGGYSQQGYNTTSLSDLYNSQNSQGNGNGYPLPPLQITDNPYRNVFLFIGPSVGVGNEKLFADFRFMMGIYSSSFNNLYYYAGDTSGYNDSKFTAPSSVQFGFLFGASLRYKLNEKVSFLFKVDMIISKQSFNVHETDESYGNGNYNNNGQYAPQETDEYMTSESNVSVFSPSIGIALNLDKPVKKP